VKRESSLFQIIRDQRKGGKIEEDGGETEGPADAAVGGSPEARAVDGEDDGEARDSTWASQSEQERRGLYVFQDRMPAGPWRWLYYVRGFCGRLSLSPSWFLMRCLFSIKF